MLLLAAALLLFLAPSKQGRAPSYADAERRYMPEEIATGQLVLSEETVRVRQPARVVAKPDQVYLTRAGELVLVETKTRAIDRVHDYDRVEIGVQAFALRHGAPERLRARRVAGYGYIRIKREGHPPSYHRVPLLSDAQVVAMRARRLALDAGLVEPAGPATPRICPKCSKRATCPRAAAG